MPEITKEMIDDAKKCFGNGCGNCKMKILIKNHHYSCSECVEALANALEKSDLSLMIDCESRTWATDVVVAYRTIYMTPDHYGDIIKIIERPKSRIREIAEEMAVLPTSTPSEKYLVDIIEKAILIYKSELEGKK